MDPQPVIHDLIAALAQSAYLTAVLAVAYFVLLAFLAMVAIFSRGERSIKAYRVLKLLALRKSDPPGSDIT